MSYLHCPACSRAYNLAKEPSCPYCPAVAAPIDRPVDPVDEIAAAVERLARALAQATPAERAAAAACMQRLALPEPPPAEVPIETWRTERRALTPAPRPVAKRRPLLATIALAVLDRVAPHAPRRLFRVVERVKALAA